MRIGGESAARFSCMDHMDRLTGIPAAVAAIMIADGRVRQAGAMPPEAAFEPRAFLAELKRQGIRITRSVKRAREAV